MHASRQRARRTAVQFRGARRRVNKRAIICGHWRSRHRAHANTGRCSACCGDFSSLYPSIIASSGAGSRFGLPDIVTDLMRRRRESSDPGLARACKLVANSLYGQLASPTSPMYDPGAANEITAEGRNRLKSLVEHLTESGGTVVYGDTDSCMVSFSACADGGGMQRHGPPLRIVLQQRETARAHEGCRARHI